MSGTEGLSQLSPVTLPEVLGYVLFAGVGFVFMFSPDSISLLFLEVNGINVPNIISPVIPGALGFLSAFGWLIITLHWAYSSSAKE